MTITYPLDLPASPGFSGYDITFMSSVGMAQSPYDGSQEVQEWPSQFWMATITLPPLNTVRRRLWTAFAARLNGIKGTFLMGDPFGQIPAGSAASVPGAPQVDGAHTAQASMINVKGLPVSAAGYLLEGSYIQIGTAGNTKLFMVRSDVDTDGAGKAAIDIWPNLRVDLAGDEEVIVSGCRGLFRMTQNQQNFPGRPGPLTDYTFTCVEAL